MNKFNIRDNKGRFIYKHGLSGSYLYRIWSHMMKRCYDEKNHAYMRYGGRNIKVYKNWHNVKNFADYIIKNIGHRPDKSYSLDRIDNDGNYEPNNIKWSTPTQQANNRRTPITNTTGIKNISYRKDINKFRARVTINNKRMHIGNFNTVEEADLAIKLFYKEI